MTDRSPRPSERRPPFFAATRRTKISAALIFSVNAWLLFFVGCAPQQKVWVKSGATIQDFNQDKYRCIQESNRRAYSGDAYGYSGGDYINWNVFNACMEAAGWALTLKR